MSELERKRVALWLTFVLAALWWMAATYFRALETSGIVSIGLAFWILKEHRFARGPTVLVILVLVVGQWWLMEFLVAAAMWHLHGFAP